MIRKLHLSAALLALALTAAPALADGPVQQEKAAAQAAFQADRADIIAMAGNFKVRFDMQESTVWKPGYTPLDRKISGGHESVRVIEDSPNRIVLQHLLVVEDGGKSHVIKHWRQDWEYQPARVLVYKGTGKWVWEDVPAQMRAGRWSQTVYQSMIARVMPVGANGPRRRASVAGGRTGLGVRSPGVMRSVTRSMIVICRSIATSRARMVGSIGRTIPRWPRRAARPCPSSRNMCSTAIPASTVMT